MPDRQIDMPAGQARAGHVSRHALHVRRGLFLAALIAYAAVPLFVHSAPYQFTIIIADALAALAVGILLRAGLISFGHGLYFAAGAYAVAALQPVLGGGLLILLAAGTVTASVLALCAGVFVVRYRGIFFAMLNLALSMVAFTILLKFYNLTGGSDGMSLARPSLLGMTLDGASHGLALFYISLILAVICGVLVAGYLRTALGWGLGAIRDREIRVAYLGVSPRAILLLAYVLTGALAGLGGAIAALAVGHVGPDLAYWTTSARFLVIAVVGGIGHVLGPMAGAVVYQLLSVNVAQYLPHVWSLLLGVVILVIIRFAPAGLWGIHDMLWRHGRRHD